MSKVDDPQRPLWPVFENMPTEVWNIYYQGLSGRWLLGSNCYSLESAESMSTMYDRPMKILHFKLVEEIDIDTDEMRAKYKRPPRKKVTKVRQPKVITKVRMPKKKG